MTIIFISPCKKNKQKKQKRTRGLSDRGSGKCVTRLQNEFVGERLDVSCDYKENIWTLYQQAVSGSRLGDEVRVLFLGVQQTPCIHLISIIFVFICSSWSYWKRVHLLRGSLSNTVTLRVCNCVQTTQKETKMHVLELGQLVTNYSQALKELDHREL